jgi:hypothetical protein
MFQQFIILKFSGKSETMKIYLINKIVQNNEKNNKTKN